jgi:hypothetical protein
MVLRAWLMIACVLRLFLKTSASDLARNFFLFALREVSMALCFLQTLQTFLSLIADRSGGSNRKGFEQYLQIISTTTAPFLICDDDLDGDVETVELKGVLPHLINLGDQLIDKGLRKILVGSRAGALVADCESHGTPTPSNSSRAKTITTRQIMTIESSMKSKSEGFLM